MGMREVRLARSETITALHYSCCHYDHTVCTTTGDESGPSRITRHTIVVGPSRELLPRETLESALDFETQRWLDDAGHFRCLVPRGCIRIAPEHS